MNFRAIPVSIVAKFRYHVGTGSEIARILCRVSSGAVRIEPETSLTAWFRAVNLFIISVFECLEVPEGEAVSKDQQVDFVICERGATRRCRDS